MFEHWKAYKNRLADPSNVPEGHMPKSSRAESFASLVSVISKGIADARSILSLKPGEQNADIEWMKDRFFNPTCRTFNDFANMYMELEFPGKFERFRTINSNFTVKPLVLPH